LEVRVVERSSTYATFEPEAAYRLGGSAARLIFYPMHEVDRRLRPAIWSEGPIPLIY
jgi:hypothetical protein